jgi:hypothetical protein
MSIVLLGSTSGSITLQEPAVAGSNILSLPAVTSTLATEVNGVLYPLTSGTSQASTSGTSIDFTSIPSWVKRVTVMFNGVSLNGSSDVLVQLGDSGGIEDTGYISTWAVQSSGANSTAGYIVRSGVSTVTLVGHLVITLVSTNLWVSTGITGASTTQVGLSAGSKTLSATLDRIRITTANGTDTFDAGSINILYE